MKMLSCIGRSVALAPLLAMSFVSHAFGQGFAGPDPVIPGTPGPGTGVGGIRNIILNALSIVLSFLALVAVIVIVIAGIRLIVSMGDEEQKEKAKKTIIYALIGLAIVLFARVIVGLITVTLAGTVGR